MNYSFPYWTFNHFPKFGHTLTGTTPCTFPKKTLDVTFINFSFFGFSLRSRFTSRSRYWCIRTPYNRVWSCLAHVFVNVVYVLLFNIGPAAAAPVVLYVHNSANQPPGEISLSPLIQPRESFGENFSIPKTHPCFGRAFTLGGLQITSKYHVV